MKFKVIELSNPEWDSYINSSYIYDFHHTSCFHKIEQKDGEEAFLFIAEKQTKEFIALPLVKRAVPGTNYFDMTSIYGYCGPVASKPLSQIDKELIRFFKKEFINYSRQKNIVSVFSRLHPLIDQLPLFEIFGHVKDLNKTVAIDLTITLEEQRKAYRKSNKSEINQLKKKKGYVIENVEKSDDNSIKEFVDIYHLTMRKVDAKPYYFFDFDYFKKLLNNSCFECDLLVTRKENEMAAGAIFTRTNSIMQYHLAGTKDDFTRDTPMKLILDEARLLGSKRELRFLHLGGGVGGSDKDSLFYFKSGFSKKFYQFSVWNLVVNKPIYQELVDEKKINKEDFPNFFPLYRAKS